MNKYHWIATSLAVAMGFLPANAPAFDELPIHFEPATAANVYTARRGGLALTLSERGAVLRLARGGRDAALTLRLDGATPRHAQPENRLPGHSNYFLGNDAPAWRRGVPHYGRVRYEEVYPGIDLVYYGAGDELEYDFVLAAGANPANIRMRYDGASSVQIDDEGNLRLAVTGGELVHRKPVSYQLIDGARREVTSEFRVRRGNGRSWVTFELGDYDARHPLTIDPVLSYATYLGGTNDNEQANSIVVDAAGALYVAGQTNSNDFPVTGGAAQGTHGGNFDAFVAKLNPAGTAFEYVTYLGGSASEEAHILRVDPAGNAFLAGKTTSGNFPVTAGAAQTAAGGNDDVYVVKLSATGGTLLYGTYLGGSSSEPRSSQLGGFEIDANGDAFVYGDTQSTDFPTTPGAPQTTRGNPNAAQFDEDLFLTRINSNGTALVFSTYHGGSAIDATDDGSTEGQLLAMTGAGAVWIAGTTESADFPTTAGAFDTSFNGPSGGNPGGGDAFVARFDTTAGTRVFSTLIGGTADEFAAALDVDAAGNAYLATSTGSASFPVTAGAADTSYNGGTSDVALVKIAPSGATLGFATFLGGGNVEGPIGVRVNGAGSSIHIAGSTQSTNFTTTAGAADTTHNGGGNDGFIARYDGAGALVYSTFAGSSDSDGVVLLETDAFGNAYALLGDSAGDAFVSAGGRAFAGGFDDYFVKLNAAGSTFLDASYLGGALDDFSLAMTVDGSQNVYFGGTSASSNYPVTPGAAQAVKAGAAGSEDIAIAKFATTPDGSVAQPGTLALSADNYTLAEGAANAAIVVMRSGGASGAVSVTCTAASDGGDTASAGADYTAATATLTWADGDATNKTCSVAIANDALVESTETFSVTLGNVTGGATIGAPASATISITDDDAPPVAQPGTVSFNPAAYSLQENGGSVTLTLTRTGGADGSISVSVASGGGSASAADYTAVTQVLSWADGDTAAKTVALTVIDDATDEGDETVGFTLSNPTGGATLGLATATVTILDDDSPPGPVPQTANVRGKYGKGSMDGGFLAALLAVAACVTVIRRRSARRSAALAAAAVLSTYAHAENGWYVGVRAGSVESTRSASDIERGLVARGHDVTVEADDRQPTYSLLAGYRFANGLALESSFVELGEYEVAVTGTTTSPETLSADTKSLLADGGRGVSAALAWHLPLGKTFELTPRVGAYYWDSRQSVSNGAIRIRDRESGVDLTGGITLAWKIDDRWVLGIGWESWAAGTRNDLHAVTVMLAHRMSR